MEEEKAALVKCLKQAKEQAEWKVVQARLNYRLAKMELEVIEEEIACVASPSASPS